MRNHTPYKLTAPASRTNKEANEELRNSIAIQFEYQEGSEFEYQEDSDTNFLQSPIHEDVPKRNYTTNSEQLNYHRKV